MKNITSLNLERFEKFGKFDHPTERVKTEDGLIEKRVKHEAPAQHMLLDEERTTLHANTAIILEVADQLGKMIKVKFKGSDEEVSYKVDRKDDITSSGPDRYNDVLNRTITLSKASKKKDRPDPSIPNRIEFVCKKGTNNPKAKFEALKLSYSYADQNYKNIFWANESNRLIQKAKERELAAV